MMFREVILAERAPPLRVQDQPDRSARHSADHTTHVERIGGGVVRLDLRRLGLVADTARQATL